MCAQLEDMEFVEVAERVMALLADKVADEHPLALLDTGALAAILSYCDFFPLQSQRKALQASASITAAFVSSSSTAHKRPQAAGEAMEKFRTQLRPVIPSLTQMICNTQTDDEVLRNACHIWRLIVDFLLDSTDGRAELPKIFDLTVVKAHFEKLCVELQISREVREGHEMSSTLR